MSNWASHAIEVLSKGENVIITPHGNSMSPRIESGDTVELSPRIDREIREKDIVLAKVNGKVYLHLVAAIRGEQYQIANNSGYVNGWTTREKIYGFAVRITSKKCQKK